jgi:hypothetical protein
LIPRHLQIGIAILLAGILIAAISLRRMRGRAATAPPRLADSRPVAPPVAGPTEQVTLYVAYDDPGILHPQAAHIPLPTGRQQRAQELLRALLEIYLSQPSPHPIPPGSEVRDVYLVDPNLAVIDTNAAFADGHRSGILVEELTVTSLVQTLTANVPGISRVKLLVDGKERETLAGHADLSALYDAASVSKAVEQLQGAP